MLMDSNKLTNLPSCKKGLIEATKIWTTKGDIFTILDWLIIVQVCLYLVVSKFNESYAASYAFNCGTNFVFV